LSHDLGKVDPEYIYLKPIFMPHGCPTGHEGFMTQSPG
jgi:hypothetical protein